MYLINVKASMRKFIKHHKVILLRFLSLFILVNIGLYVFVFLFHRTVPFSTSDYAVAYHVFPDPRIQNKPYDFLQSWAVFDAQWYTRIILYGYPRINGNIPLNQLHVDTAAPYAFFPAYPVIVRLMNLLFHNALASGFLVNHILLIINFVLLVFLVSRISNLSVALKTAFLLFLFPMSIFYHSMFAEGIFLTFLILFSYFLIRKKLIGAAVCYGLLTVTKANSFPLILLILIQYARTSAGLPVLRKLREILVLLISSLVPLSLWALFSFVQTANPLIFLKVRGFWLMNTYQLPWKLFVPYIFKNIYSILEFPFLPWHSFASSRIEIITVFIIVIILIKSRNKIPYEFWTISFFLWLFPLLSTTLMSFTRYQIVSFPLFYFLAKKLKGWKYGMVLGLFTISQFLVSLYFVNWVWLG